MSEVLQHDLFMSLPLLVVAGGALLQLLLETILGVRASGPKLGLRDVIPLYTLIFALFSLMVMLGEGDAAPTIFSGLLYVDGFSWFISFVILLGATIGALLGLTRLSAEGVNARGEYYVLYLMSVAGALIFATAAELITLFLGLELMSLALYCLCGSALGVPGASMKRSAEAALKYFLLGSFSSAFLLYGIALLYGLTGSTVISVIAAKAAGVDSTVMLLAIGLMLIGFMFKIGAVPFHFWVPDVYQGSPTAVTAFMACVIKAASVAAALRLFSGAFAGTIVFWSGAIWLIAVLTMVLGNFVALRQRSVKRMLAYSSIAHAGYMLVAVIAPDGQYGGGGAILYYLVAYTAMTMGAFGVVLAVASEHTESPHPDDIARFNGLGYRRPVLGALMALFVLSLAGIPPGMAGLVGKFYLFSAAVKANYVGLAIIGVITSAVSCYYYLRVIVAMYFLETEVDEDAKVPELGFSLCSALGLCALGVIVLGLFPEWLHQGAVLLMGSL